MTRKIIVLALLLALLAPGAALAAWSGKIVSVEVRQDTVQVQVEIVNDAPPLTISRSYTFGRAEELTKEALAIIVKAEISRIGDLYLKAEEIKAEVGKAITAK